ncbi:MAG: hypothetical protein Q4C81_10125 [Kocuria sp.]|nr:hypothetical protein [Kocuria sp.]
MARSVRGRIAHGGLPSWPPLRVRGLVNGLCLTTVGIGIFHLTWNMLNFQVFDASHTAMVLRVFAIWCAVGLPLACVAIGVHMVLTAITATDRLLLSHGSADWDPGEHDEVLRGVRVRNWRPGTGPGSGAISARTLGWLPVHTPWSVLPLGVGMLVGIGMAIWLATGYGRAALIMLVAVAWMAWRMWRAWGGWVDFRAGLDDHTDHDTMTADSSSHLAVITADEAWDREDRLETARDTFNDVEHTTAVIPVYREREPDNVIIPEPVPEDPDTQPEDPDPVVLVDRSAERARQARMRRHGEPETERPSRKGRGRGTGRGLRSYLGERVTADAVTEPSSAPEPENGETPTAPLRTVEHTGAPTMAEAEQNIYGRRVEADSIFGYLLGRRKGR